LGSWYSLISFWIIPRLARIGEWLSGKKKALHLSLKHRRLPRFSSRVAFPWADDFAGDPTAIKITGLRAHGLAIDEALDPTWIEGKVV
jgi:hypothetical protein